MSLKIDREIHGGIFAVIAKEVRLAALRDALAVCMAIPNYEANKSNVAQKAYIAGSVKCEDAILALIDATEAQP